MIHVIAVMPVPTGNSRSMSMRKCILCLRGARGGGLVRVNLFRGVLLSCNTLGRSFQLTHKLARLNSKSTANRLAHT